MDPDQKLDRIRSLLTYSHEWDRTDSFVFAELVRGLDKHLTEGGDLPKEWDAHLRSANTREK